MSAVGSDRSATIQVILGFLEQHGVMTVASADLQGVPWATPVFYVNDGFRVYWLANPNQRLGAYLQANPRAVGTIIGDGHEPRRARGLQIEGGVRVVTSWREYVRRAPLFLRKFPELGRELLPTRAGGRRLGEASKLRLYELDGERCWFTDHSQGLGSRLELDLRGAASSDGKADVR